MQSDVNLNVLQLRAAVAVAKHSSFVNAAHELQISQSSFSRVIQGLEEAFGTSLFIRTTRRVELTAAGEDLVAMAERILADLDITIENMAGHGAQKRSQIIVSCLMSVIPGPLHVAIAEFHKRFPGADVHIREGIEDAIEQDIRSGIADIGIAAIDTAATDFENRKLFKEELSIAFAKPHEFEDLDQVPLIRLKGQPLVSFPKGARMRQVVDSAAATAGFSLRHVCTANQLITLATLAASGVGITIVPSSAMEFYTRLKLQVRPLVQPKLHRNLGLIRLANRPKTELVDHFSDCVVASFKRR